MADADAFVVIVIKYFFELEYIYLEKSTLDLNNSSSFFRLETKFLGCSIIKQESGWPSKFLAIIMLM